MNNLPNIKRKGRNVHSFLAFLLFVCLSSLPCYIQAQEKKNITLDVKNETVENVFNQLSKQTGYKFFYDQEIVNAAPRISIKARNSSLENILSMITVQTNLYFNKKNNTIKSTRTKTVNGTVTDQNGEPIIGANVLVKGTTNGIITDINGNYSLANVTEDATIQFSYIGYQTTEVKANSKELARIILKEDSELLDEGDTYII